ncbi:undecaprenyldiphospho-muramoylpentapeptide beta-N-acetylglucosaminyltransferase [Planctomicrobium sp. SH527]|uniref:undecaprenyldiphospho-muramoylpentapeptide beta-N-acetylglucosaminyltransferase n=1 Tax=Planctomicrobium sp. SH527 TaxID=3448123 RepID=UPI003F5C952C
MSPSNWTLIVSGGGSGGHLFPALAVIEALSESPSPPSRIVFFTTDRGIEQTVLTESPTEQIALSAVESVEFRKRPFRSIWKMSRAILQARRHMKRFPNPIVLATGGFGSLPGGIAAWRNRVPLILLEQNAVSGRATSLLSPLASKICTSFRQTEMNRRWSEKCVFTGNPVRRNIAEQWHRPQETDRKILLVMGGSQGAKMINQAMFNFARNHAQLLTGWKIVHHTGITDCPTAEAIYRECDVEAVVSPFFADMPALYRQAGLVVSRAGGTSLAEFACAGIPAILIPYPNSLRDHQAKNAQVFVEAGAALCIKQSDADFETGVARELQRVLGNLHLREQMASAMHSLAVLDAAAQVVDVLRSQRT